MSAIETTTRTPNPFQFHLHPVPASGAMDIWRSTLPLLIHAGSPLDAPGYASFLLLLDSMKVLALEGPACRHRLDLRDRVAAIVLTSGAACMSQGKGLWQLNRGDCLITPGGSLDWSSTAFSATFLVFSQHLLTEVVRALKLPLADPSLRRPTELLDGVLCRSSDGAEVASLLQAIHLLLCISSDLQASSPCLLPHLGLDQQLGILSALLAFPDLRHSVHSRTGRLPGSDHTLDPVINYIEAHLSEPLSLAAIAAHGHYSRRALQYAFRRTYGCTVTQWIRARRLDLAHGRLRLAAAGERVSEIARACGYRSMSLFSIEFQQRFHIRPSELLRQGRADAAASPPGWTRDDQRDTP
ncbi:MAG: AraC family transcriptional regulator [Chitinophagaceae bacterium]|nr:AraC family transcriptional regulator [Chitinophagaceae bacterium]